MLSCLTDCNSF